jgi:hypothetical protein
VGFFVFRVGLPGADEHNQGSRNKEAMTTYGSTAVPLEVVARAGGGPLDYLGFPWNVENELERLKNRLLREALLVEPSPALVAPLRRAANEAAALAWLEPYPLLAFPELFRELTVASARRAPTRKTSKSLGQANLTLVQEVA